MFHKVPFPVDPLPTTYVIHYVEYIMDIGESENMEEKEQLGRGTLMNDWKERNDRLLLFGNNLSSRTFCGKVICCDRYIF